MSRVSLVRRDSKSWVTGPFAAVRGVQQLLGCGGSVVRRHRPHGSSSREWKHVGVWAISVGALATAATTYMAIRQQGPGNLPEHRGDSCGNTERREDGSQHHPRCRCGEGSICVGLVAYLQPYVAYQTRDRALLLTLMQRARAWAMEQKVSHFCFANYAATSVAVAMQLSNAEQAGRRILSSDRARAAQTLFNGRVNAGRGFGGVLQDLRCGGWTEPFAQLFCRETSYGG